MEQAKISSSSKTSSALPEDRDSYIRELEHALGQVTGVHPAFMRKPGLPQQIVNGWYKAQGRGARFTNDIHARLRRATFKVHEQRKMLRKLNTLWSAVCAGRREGAKEQAGA